MPEDEQPPVDPWPDDGTAPVGGVADGPADGGAGSSTGPGGQPPVPGVDETARLPRVQDQPPGDQTAVLPPVDGQAGSAARWSGRAGVPPAGTRTTAPPIEEEWGVNEPPPNRRWWLPILIGIAALILIALILLGLWLAMRGQNAPAPAPSPSPSPAASPSPSPSPAASPTPSPSASTVVLPDLTRVPVSSAEQLLDGLGLHHRVTQVADGSLPPGTVISTNPAAGSTVPIGSEVELRVATAPSPSPSLSLVSPSPR